MAAHSHKFVEEYEGLVGFGMDRETDENTLIYYLQKFSDDDLAALIRKRMSDEDLAGLFEHLAVLLKKYLSEPEYHRFFLKEDQ
jgi:hypothetical protein